MNRPWDTTSSGTSSQASSVTSVMSKLSRLGRSDILDESACGEPGEGDMKIDSADGVDRDGGGS